MLSVSIFIYNADCAKLTFSFADRLKKCSALGTVGRCIGCIFNVSAGIAFSVRCKKTSSHFKPGIRRIRPFHCLHRFLYHLFYRKCFFIFFYAHTAHLPSLMLNLDSSIILLQFFCNLYNAACPQPISTKLKKMLGISKRRDSSRRFDLHAFSHMTGK